MSSAIDLMNLPTKETVDKRSVLSELGDLSYEVALGAWYEGGVRQAKHTQS